MGVNIEPNSMGLPTIVAVSSDYQGSLLKEGDIISRINGVELNRSTYQEIMKNINEMKIGEDYEIDIVRNDQEMKITEKLYPKYDKNVFKVDQNASGKSKKMQEILVAPYE